MSTLFKSNNAIVAMSHSPAFTTGSQSGVLMAGVQNTSFGFSQDRQKLKQLGSYELSIDHINRMPDIDFSVDYLFSPSQFNETSLGIVTGLGHIEYSESGEATGPSPFLNALDSYDRDFYIITNKGNNAEKFDTFEFYDESGNANYSDVSGSHVVKIGNAFLTNYSLGFSVGQIPIVSTSFKCSNLEYSEILESGESIAAINLQSGNNSGAGTVDLFNLDFDSNDFFDFNNKRTPSFIAPSDVKVSLEDLQVGGVSLTSDPLITSFSFNLPIERVDLYGLGSDYPYSRKVKYPINGTVSMDLLVSGFETGNIYGMIDDESYYDFVIGIENLSGNAENLEMHQSLFFNNLRLENVNYQMQVNDSMSYNMNFSFQITGGA